MNEINVPIMQFSVVNRNQTLYNIDAFVTYNDIRKFLEKRNVTKYVVSMSIGSVTIKIKRLFFNIKRLQADIDDVRPIGIRVICCKYDVKEWLNELSIVKKLKSFFNRVTNGCN